MACRDRARCSSSKPTKLPCVDDSERLGPVGGEEDHDGPGSVRERDVGLEAGDAEFPVRRRHDVEKAVVEAEAKARAILDRTAGDALEARPHRRNCVERRQKLLDVGLAQVEGQDDV